MPGELSKLKRWHRNSREPDCPWVMEGLFGRCMSTAARRIMVFQRALTLFPSHLGDGCPGRKESDLPIRGRWTFRWLRQSVRISCSLLDYLRPSSLPACPNSLLNCLCSHQHGDRHKPVVPPKGMQHIDEGAQSCRAMLEVLECP